MPWGYATTGEVIKAITDARLRELAEKLAELRDPANWRWRHIFRGGGE